MMIRIVYFLTVMTVIAIVLAIGSINNRLTPTIAFADCFNLDEVDNISLKNSRQTSQSNSNLHYCIIEGENEQDNSLVKNLHARHGTLIVNKTNRLYGNFTPENNELQSLKIFLTKSFKMKIDHLISGKKYDLKNVQCGHSGCSTFRADIPNNINKRTY